MSALKKTSDTVTDKLNNIINTTAFFEQFVIKSFQPMFTFFQQKRWQTKNSSEGKEWDPILLSYAKYKKTKYANAPFHGNELLIATGRLYKSLTLDSGGEWERVLTDKTVVFNFPVEYAAQVATFRPILEFSNASLDKFKDEFKQWMKKQWQVRT